VLQKKIEGKNMAAQKNKSNEIKITRIYDAPVKAVWDAWTDLKQVAKWWGPRGFTLTTHSKDLRAGGHWKYTMHGPDGTDYENITIYHEVVEREKLVYDHGGSEDRPPLFRVTALFSEFEGSKTKLEMTMTFKTLEEAVEIGKFIKKANGYSTWDRLAEFLTKESSGKEQFVVNRSFDAPIDVLYRMWTDPKHFARWLPPTGFTMEFLKAYIKTGGTSFYKMTGPFTMYGRAKYLEISPTRLVYTQQFCDEKNEKGTRHPMAPAWPETMLTTVTFSEEGPGRTRVTITWEVQGDATKEEMDAFIQGRAGMTMGWTGSFDKLEALLEANRN
jgi:uncharacterized protein YndB with AHSA1/START domain